MIFLSYAREDRELVRVLRDDIEALGHRVWMDGALTGGQAWWDEILSTIRQSAAFVLVLSPSSNRSQACASELDFAVRCGRPLLGVMIQPTILEQSPLAIARTQIVSYVSRTVEEVISLSRALAHLPPVEPFLEQVELPSPPQSYAEPLWRRLSSLNLTVHEQAEILGRLKVHLADPYERADAHQLVVALRQRSDVAYSIAREIDDLVIASPSTTREPTQPPAKQVPLPPAPRDSVVTLIRDSVEGWQYSELMRAGDLFIRPNIPRKKLDSAQAAAAVPSDEEIALLADCTTKSGNAKDALLMGERGIYYAHTDHFSRKPFAVSYENLSRKVVTTNAQAQPKLVLGDERLTMAGCSPRSVDFVANVIARVVAELPP